MAELTCGHCEHPQRGSASVTRDAARVPLCHPDDGLDCYRLVTVYHHPTPCQCSDEREARDEYARGEGLVFHTTGGLMAWLDTDDAEAR